VHYFSVYNDNQFMRSALILITLIISTFATFQANALPGAATSYNQCLFQATQPGDENLATFNCRSESDPKKFCECVSKVGAILNVNPEEEMPKVVDALTSAELIVSRKSEYFTLREQLKQINLTRRLVLK
jgi:hypothetical protein